MGLQYRRRVRVGKSSWVNLSGSGASVSHRAGPVTVNSRGGSSIRIARGLSFRSYGGRRGGGGFGLVGLFVWLAVMSFWAMFALVWLVVRLSWLAAKAAARGAVLLVQAVRAARARRAQEVKR